MQESEEKLRRRSASQETASQESASREVALSAMHRFRRRYGHALEWLTGALMVILAVEVTLGIVFRVAGHSLVWYDEVASILLAWLTFYGSALASVRRAHIGCPEVVEQLPPNIKRMVAIFAQVLVMAFFALLGWVGWTIMPLLAGDTLVSLPSVPVNFVQSVLPISSVLILVAEVMHFIDLLKNEPEPEPEPEPDGRTTTKTSDSNAAPAEGKP